MKLRLYVDETLRERLSKRWLLKAALQDGFKELRLILAFINTEI